MLAGGQKFYYLDFETAMFLLGGGSNGRYYDAATGRFVSEDRIRYGAWRFSGNGSPGKKSFAEASPTIESLLLNRSLKRTLPLNC
jgi:hypothetical protein